MTEAGKTADAAMDGAGMAQTQNGTIIVQSSPNITINGHITAEQGQEIIKYFQSHLNELADLMQKVTAERNRKDYAFTN